MCHLEHKGIHINFTLIPSHIGANGNELADSIALESRQLDSCTYDPSQVCVFFLFQRHAIQIKLKLEALSL